MLTILFACLLGHRFSAHEVSSVGSGAKKNTCLIIALISEKVHKIMKENMNKYTMLWY